MRKLWESNGCVLDMTMGDSWQTITTSGVRNFITRGG